MKNGLAPKAWQGKQNIFRPRQRLGRARSRKNRMPDFFFGLLHQHLLNRLAYAHYVHAGGQWLHVIAGREGECFHHRTAYTIYIYTVVGEGSVRRNVPSAA